MHMILAVVVAAAFVGFDVQPAKAYTAPWCAVINLGTGNMYWDCQYSSIEQCRPNVLAGNRGFCNLNPSFLAYGSAANKQYRNRAPSY